MGTESNRTLASGRSKETTVQRLRLMHVLTYNVYGTHETTPGGAINSSRAFLTAPSLRRYLAICQSLEDGNGIAEAHFLLGIVASSLAKYATAAAEFEAALQAAKASGNKDIARFSRVHIGMAKGKINLAQQLIAADKDLQRLQT